MVKRPQRFTNIVNENLLGYINIIEFTLSVIETNNVLEPLDVPELNNYKETIFSPEGY